MAAERARAALVGHADAYLSLHTFAHTWIAHDDAEGDLMPLARWKSRTITL
jgi:hypothetical protein